MTKSIKKILAALLVVATLALMIPFSASAAADASTEVTFSVDTQEKANAFKFDIYKLADVKTSTGEVTTVSGLPAAVVNAINKEGTDVNTKALIAAAKANLAGLGEPVKTWDDKNLKVTYTDLKAGIYYVHPVALGVSTKAQDSIVVLPKYDETTKSWVAADEVKLADKVSTKGINLDKEITKVDDVPTTNTKYTTAGLDSVVGFKLTANVPGSTETKLKNYVIYDKMDNGLTFDASSVVVKYGNDTLAKDTDYKITTSNSTYTFGIEFVTENGYVPDRFYTGKEVTVEFNAEVNDKATVGQESNNNQVFLAYTNDDTSKVEPGPTVQVFAFNLQVVKVDNNGTTKLAGAEFKLYKADKTTKIATATSDNNGLVQFTKNGKQIQLAAGKYYVQETAAPEGYVLPTGDAAWTEITIDPTISQDASAGTNDAQYKLTALVNSGDNTLAFVEQEVKNIKISTPHTGGMGTTIFTVCGASLIVLAGVMFVVLKRKKTSK